MNTLQMEYFIATAKYGSFSKTAQLYYTTQPTISRQISLLEEELGYELFERGVKPLVLTAPGKVFFESLQPILREIDNLKRKGELAARGNYGRLSVTFPLGLCVENFFADILLELKATFAGLNISYRKENPNTLKDSLLSHKTDVVLTFHTPVMEDPDLSFIDLEQINSYILVGCEHPLVNKEFLTDQDIIQEKIYLPGPLSGYSYSYGQLAGFWINRENIIEVDSIATALINTRFGNGITLANNYMDAIHDSDRYKSFPAFDNSRNPQMSIVTRKHTSNPAVPFFIDMIRSMYKNR